MKNFHDLNIKSKFNVSEGRCDGLEAQNDYKPVNEGYDVSENRDKGLCENEERDESKYDMIDHTKMFQSGEDRTTKCLQYATLVENDPLKISIQSDCDEIINRETNILEDEAEDSKCFIQQYLVEEGKLCNNVDTISLKKEGIPEFFQHSDLNTLVKCEDSDFGIQSGCVERLSEKMNASEDDIGDSKCFIQPYLNKEEKLWESIDTSSKKIGTIECSQPTTLVESTQLGIGIQSDCDEMRNIGNNMSDAEDSKSSIHQLLDEEGKLYNNIDTITLREEGAVRELHELLEMEDAKTNTDVHQRTLKSPMREYSTGSNLQRQIDTVHPKVKKKQLSVANRGNLKFRIVSVHLKADGAEKLNCQLCDYNALNSSDLDIHFNSVHTEEKIYKCQMCDFSTLKRFDLKRHIDSVHLKVKKHECHFCDFSTAYSGNLKCHIDSLHLRVKKYECHLCDFSTAYSGSLKGHIDDVHTKEEKGKKHKCHSCDFSCTSSSNLKSHIDSVHLKVKKHKCNLCDFSFTSSSNLKCHINSVHLKVKREKKHKCDLCDLRFVSSTNLNCHIDSVHLKVKKHKCHLCDYSTARLPNLKCHIDSVHLKANKRICHLCDASFTSSTNLRCHMDSVHLKVKKYECQFCDYSTAYRGDLSRHIGNVHRKAEKEKKEKKHKCHVCDYSTTKRFNLKTHINSVHLKVKKHKCHLCDFSSTFSSNLKCHIDSVHLKVKKTQLSLV